ncbi:cytidylyltransferase domain-containing protein [Halobacillus sp. B23F22_1]|uniref:cytidylyltransferase domain-containing protein n=1 Tax=Halobacillus sp. B23F22_1 TaxID=3459514 RepID=UPI00373FA494
MKVAAIIQARMGSTRLPGKVLKQVLGKPLLGFQIERMQRSKKIDELILATTTEPADDALWSFANEHSISAFRGSEKDVLGRYYEAASYHKADVVIRLTSDCPLIDPVVIDEVIDAYFHQQGACRYVSNTLARTYPRGMDTEVFSYRALKRCHDNARSESEREHVTSYIHHHKDEFSIYNVKLEQDESHHRWTVDTAEDYQLIKRILEHFYPGHPNFTLRDALDFVKQYPELSLINAHIDQKKS